MKVIAIEMSQAWRLWETWVPYSTFIWEIQFRSAPKIVCIGFDWSIFALISLCFTELDDTAECTNPSPSPQFYEHMRCDLTVAVAMLLMLRSCFLKQEASLLN